MNEIEIKKFLYKSKGLAEFTRYCHGILYYSVALEEGIFEFPIDTIEKDEISYEIPTVGSEDQSWEFIETIKLSEDLGTTDFGAEIKASELIRWIIKAKEKGLLIKLN